jgi:hypothetical protein
LAEDSGWWTAQIYVAEQGFAGPLSRAIETSGLREIAPLDAVVRSLAGPRGGQLPPGCVST